MSIIKNIHLCIILFLLMIVYKCEKGDSLVYNEYETPDHYLTNIAIGGIKKVELSDFEDISDLSGNDIISDGDMLTYKKWDYDGDGGIGYIKIFYEFERNYHIKMISHYADSINNYYYAGDVVNWGSGYFYPKVAKWTNKKVDLYTNKVDIIITGSSKQNWQDRICLTEIEIIAEIPRDENEYSFSIQTKPVQGLIYFDNIRYGYSPQTVTAYDTGYYSYIAYPSIEGYKIYEGEIYIDNDVLSHTITFNEGPLFNPSIFAERSISNDGYPMIVWKFFIGYSVFLEKIKINAPDNCYWIDNDNLQYSASDSIWFVGSDSDGDIPSGEFTINFIGIIPDSNGISFNINGTKYVY